MRRSVSGGSRPVLYALYLADLDRDSTDSHGVMNYAIHLVENVPKYLNPNERLMVYSNESIREELPDGDVEHRLLQKPRNRLTRVWNDQKSWWVARRDGVRVIHYPKGYIPFRYGHGPRMVTTLHDDIVLQYAAGRWDHPARAKLRYFAWQTRYAMNRADVILTDSDFSRTRLRGWAETWGLVAVDPIVTHLGPTTTLPDQAPATDRPYFLIFASPYPHKRFGEALRFTLRFIEAEGLDAEVRVVGSSGADTSDRRVVSAGSNVPGSAISALLAGALAAISASEYEGFGLLPLDAHHVETGAVFSLNEAATELFAWLPGGYVGGDYQSFSRALKRVLALGEAERRRLVEEASSRFSWEAVTQDVVNAYRIANGLGMVDMQQAWTRGSIS